MLPTAVAGLKRGRAETMLDEVRTAVQRWPEFAEEAKEPASMRDQIRSMHRMDFNEG